MTSNLCNVGVLQTEGSATTDGPNSELIYAAPLALAVGNNSVRYQVMISEDQVRFFRDGSIPVLYFDIAPGVSHTYRIEVFGEDLYVLWIDGEEVDSGLPEQHPYPFLADDSIVNFRAKTQSAESNSAWNFIRWGQLQETVGDFDSDGEVDEYDAYFFQECVSTVSGSWPGCAWADFDSDGWVGCDDAQAFIDVWTGDGDPPTFAVCECPGDLNGSLTVDASDLALLLGAWGPNPANVAALNVDGIVNAADLAQLLGAWGACK